MRGFFYFYPMRTFLDELASKVLANGQDLERTTFILPSKRAGNFLQKALARQLGKTIFAPEILSIESFIEDVAGITYATNTELLFELYSCYSKVPGMEEESFYHFSKWGQTLLQDFNEIDRYLVDTSALFGYLASVKEIERWNLKKEPTEVIQDYLKFWESLQSLYASFHTRLKDKGSAYQGMVYREAVENMETYLEERSEQHFIFAGFNALNKAEEKLLQFFLSKGKAEIHWDAHAHFVNDPLHEAGHFIRQHQQDWKVLSDHPDSWLQQGFDPPPAIEIIGTPRNTSQVKYVGSLLEKLQEKDPQAVSGAAVVLGDESLLNPLMHALPDNLPAINITMGYPLRNTPAYGFFNRLFDMYENQGPTGWYHEQVTALLSHPYTGQLLDSHKKDLSRKLLEGMARMNWLQIRQKDMLSLAEEEGDLVSQVFFPNPGSPEDFLESISGIIELMKGHMQDNRDSLGLEYLYQFHKIFNELTRYAREYPELKDLKTLHGVFRNLLEGQTVDFRGEPMEGLQLMGMLESRNLDFETVILTSVNEGILPSGKSQNSLIPFDIKKQFNLPTYKEKDAVYAYHFYRLLMRAKKVYLLYNTVPDTLEGGERSRLISQLMTDPLLGKNLRHRILAPEIRPQTRETSVIHKDDLYQARVRELAAKGFSPTSLSNYIRDPHTFYQKNILRIREADEVDTELAANVFGTIIHDSLEDLYKPLLNQVLTKDHIKALQKKIEAHVTTRFLEQYPGADLRHGKNLIAYHVVINYLRRFLSLEEARVQKNEIRVLGLEQEFHVPVQVTGIDYPVYLRGKVDRIEEANGILHIIDYKTGKAERTNTEVYDWDSLISDKKYDKAFQLLVYAYMFYKTKNRIPLNASIISFKNLGEGQLMFARKEHSKSKHKDHMITPDVLQDFEDTLGTLIREICNLEVPITETIV